MNTELNKIDIYQHRYSKNDNPVDKINAEYIGNLLKSKGLNKTHYTNSSKCMTYSEHCVDERGITRPGNIINAIWVKLHEKKTYSNKVFFSYIKIYLNKEFYYLECFEQTSIRINTKGAEITFYKIHQNNLESELPLILDEIFLYV